MDIVLLCIKKGCFCDGDTQLGRKGNAGGGCPERGGLGEEGLCVVPFFCLVFT